MSTDVVTVEINSKNVKKTGAEIKGLAGQLNALGINGKSATAALTGGLLAAGAAAKEALDSIANTVDEVNTLAAASGLTAKTVNALRLAANATGKSLEQVVPKGLAKKLEEARNGSTEAAIAFDAVGLSLEEIQDIDTDEAFDRVIDGLTGIEDTGRRAAIATKLMEEQGAQLLSTLGDSSELDAYRVKAEQGIKVTGEGAEAAADWQRANANLSLALETLQADIQGLMSPAAGLIDAFSIGLVYAIALVTENLRKLSKGFGQLFEGKFLDAAETLTDALGTQGLADSLVVATGETAKFWKATKDSEKATKEAGKETKTATDNLNNGKNGISGMASALNKELIPSLNLLALELAELRGDDDEIMVARLSVDLEGLDAEIKRLRAYKEQTDEVREAIRLLELQKQQLIDNGQASIDDRLEQELEAARTAAQTRLALTAETEQQTNAYLDASHRDWMRRLAEQKQAEQQARHERFSQQAELASSIVSIGEAVTTAALDRMDTESKEGRKAALAVFRVQQGLALTQVAINTALGLSTAATLPPPANFIQGGIVTAQAIASTIAIATQRPSFHIGTRAAPRSMAADERTATVTHNEVVLTPQGQQAAAEMNAGVTSNSTQVVQVVMGHKAIDIGTQTQLRDPNSTMSRAIRRGSRTIPGRR